MKRSLSATPSDRSSADLNDIKSTPPASHFALASAAGTKTTTTTSRPCSSSSPKPSNYPSTKASSASLKSPVRAKKAAGSHDGITQTAKGGSGVANGSWTAEKRGAFMDEIIAAGYKMADLDDIASRVSCSVILVVRPLLDLWLTLS